MGKMYVILLWPFISIPVCYAYGRGDTQYTYENQDWPNECSSGRNQSPIDVKTHQAKVKEFPDIKINEEANKVLGTITVDNTGHSVTFENQRVSAVIISGGGLDGEYKLAQFHFHWGKKDDEGSEHLIDSKAAPLEMHAVTIKKKFNDLSSALGSKDGAALAVFGVMFTVVESEPSTLDSFDAGGILSVEKDQKSSKTLNSNFRDLLPKKLDKFYRYNGSLTTPTCNEMVKWTIFKEKMTVTRSILEKFRRIKGAQTFNFRKPQTLNGRDIYVSRSKAENDGAAFAVHSAGYTALSVAVLAWLQLREI